MDQNRVTFDHDGDNVYIDGDTHRLMGVDTPEISDSSSKKTCGPQEVVYGQRALKFVRDAKAKADVVEIEFTGEKGYFKRPLVYVYFDGKSLGQMLLAEGLACKYSGKRDNWCGPNPPECR